MDTDNNSRVVINSRLAIPLTEIEWQYTFSSGPGGQNVNRTQSAALLKWNYLQSESLQKISPRPEWLEKLEALATKEGSILIKSQTYRDQKRNAEECLKKLVSLLKPVFHVAKKRIPTRPTKSSQRRRLQSKKLTSDKKSQRQKVKGNDYK